MRNHSFTVSWQLVGFLGSLAFRRPLAFLGSLAFLGACAPADAQTTIDADRLWTNLGALSHDSMQGRAVGTEGAARARSYIVQQLNELGLEPVQDTFAVERGAGAQTGVNIQVVIPGTEHPDRYLVLTAHYDHLGVRDGQVFNGTDDNASGTSAIIALAERLQKERPAHSVMLALLDAEEGGLSGARYLVSNFPVPLEQVLMNLNLDMVSRSTGELWVTGTYQYPELRQLVEAAQPVAPVFLRFGHDTPTDTGSDNWVNASDHAPFHQAGIPFLYFGVADHAGYHNPSDDLEHIDRTFYVAAVETIGRVFDVMDGRLEGVRVGG